MNLHKILQNNVANVCRTFVKSVAPLKFLFILNFTIITFLTTHAYRDLKSINIAIQYWSSGNIGSCS